MRRRDAACRQTSLVERYTTASLGGAMSGMTRCWRRWGWKLGLASWFVVGGAIAFSVNCAIAQQSNIVPDKTLGAESSVVIPNINGLPVEAINGGAIRGANLFHSFREFNVRQGRGAYFISPSADIQNILARVTGSNRSEILGTIGTYGNSNPNLFLINPHGIIFGPNASLDIGNAGLNVSGSGGSFVATTANAVLLGDKGIFSASDPARSNLLSINPSALWFNAISRQGIVNQSTATQSVLGYEVNGLQVPNGRSLLLVGGDVKLDGGRLTAEGGRVELGGVAGVGTVGLRVDANNLRLSFPDSMARADVSLTNGAIVNASGEGGGDIQVQGGGVTLKDNSAIKANTLGSQNGGGIFIRAEQLNIEGVSSVSANTFSSGAGGNVSIKTGKLLVRDGAHIDARTFDRGQGGTLTVNASDSVELIGTTPNGLSPSGLFTRTEGTGGAGKLTIETGQLIVRDGAEVFASTVGTGQGGTLEVTASKLVEVIGRVDSQISSGGLYSQTFGVGTGGDVTIKTGKLIVRDGGKVVAETLGAGTGADVTIKTGKLIVRDGGEVGANTFGSGKSGNLSVTASESVEVIGSSDDGQISSKLFTRTEGVGTGRDLKIETGKLIVRDGGVVGTGAFGSGKSGNLSVTASEFVELVGAGKLAGSLRASGLYSQTQGAGDAGDLRINTRELVVKDGARVSVGSLSQGNAGNIQVNATNFVNLSGVNSNGFSGGLFASTTGVGRGGSITVNTSNFRVADGAVVNALTTAEGNGGTITVNAKTLEADNGGQVLTITRSSGRSGNINLNVTDSITLAGSDPTFANRLAQFGKPRVSNEGSASGLFASTSPGSKGDGGSIIIDPRALIIRDGARISVNSLGSGKGGNIQIQAGNLTLKNQALISAETVSSQGGNIEIGLKDILLMRQGSRISTSAGTQGAGGDGGNITINDPGNRRGFVVAARVQNNDITANAFNGQGGKVTINASGIFGIAPLSRQDLQRLRPDDLDPSKLPTNDITAISQTNPSLNGQVTINTLDVDLSRAFVNLPSVPFDTNLAQGCTAGGNEAKSEFIITGRGGLPPNPGESLTTDAVQVDLVTLNPEVDGRSTTAVSTSRTSSAPPPIVEATGWVVDFDGNVVLTANAPTTPHSSWETPTKCSAPKPSS